MRAKPFREVVVLVVGTTPQIITETIYGLLQKKPPIQPDEVFVITTSVGKTIARERLLEGGRLEAFKAEYSLDKIELGNDHFIVVKNHSGNDIPDITNDIESAAMGDLITSFIRDLTDDQKVRLHCSIAGGRKTMSFYMGAALQLFGRPWDRLYHVLVSPEFESNQEFFYKPKRNKIIESRLPDGSTRKLSTRDAEIHLAELPFIRLRDKLSLQGKGFKELVQEGQKKIDTATIQPELHVDLAARSVHIGNHLIEMIPVQLMVYAALLKQKVHACKRPENPYCTDCTECFQVLQDLLTPSALEEMARDYKKMYRESPLRADELKAKWQGRVGTETIRQNISKISRTIREQLPEETLWPCYTVTAVRRYAGTRYGVRVEKEKICID
jgi:CRISPR-associated protein (TIGR02584 family)